MRFQHRIQAKRRGITAVLAMLYMALFSTLALGFYASVTTAVQVAKNQQNATRALASAESGMNFMKYNLANLGVPAGTTQDQLFQTVHDCLASRLEGYPVMNVDVYDPTSGTTTRTAAHVGMPDSETITIPDVGNGIRLDDSGSTFSVVIKKLQNGSKLEVNVYGNCAGVVANSHGTQLEYSVAQDAAKIFNFGVASKSAINMQGNVSIQGTAGNPGMGSVLSATNNTSTAALTMSGGSSISGDVSFTQSNPSLSIGTNSTISGMNLTNALKDGHVHTDAGSIQFPLIKTDAFEQYVPPVTAVPDGVTVLNSSPSGTSFKNVRIKSGSSVSFAANTTIQGVLYLEQNCNVKFTGQVNITGVIVSDTPNPAADPNNASWDLTQNVLTFAGGVSFAPVNQLPATSDFPDSLRALTGSMLLVPGYSASFQGNFNSVNGSIIASQISFGGTAGGTIYGSVVNLNDSSLNMKGTSSIIVQSMGTSNYPAGVYFGSHYSPLPATYAELVQ